MCSLKGCPIVAGGRSVAQRRPPKRSECSARTLEGCHVFCHPFRVENHFRLSSGGLRYAPTTGYYLIALQAGTPELVCERLRTSIEKTVVICVGGARQSASHRKAS